MLSAINNEVLEASSQSARLNLPTSFLDVTSAGVADNSDEDEDSSSSDSLISYSLSWIAFVVTAAFIALISNGIFGIPLYQVVDVQLSLFLTWAGLYVVVWSLFAAYDLYQWELREVVGDLVQVLAFAFLPFGAMTGYALYGWLGGGQVQGASFVFDGYFSFYTDAYRYIASVMGDFLGAISSVETPKGEMLKIDSDVLLKWTQIISGSLAALDIVRRWMRPPQSKAR